MAVLLCVTLTHTALHGYFERTLGASVRSPGLGAAVVSYQALPTPSSSGMYSQGPHSSQSQWILRSALETLPAHIPESPARCAGAWIHRRCAIGTLVTASPAACDIGPSVSDASTPECCMPFLRCGHCREHLPGVRVRPPLRACAYARARVQKRTRMHSRTHSHSHSHSRSHSHSHSHSHMHTHTRTRTHALALALERAHTPSHSHTRALNHPFHYPYPVWLAAGLPPHLGAFAFSNGSAAARDHTGAQFPALCRDFCFGHRLGTYTPLNLPAALPAASQAEVPVKRYPHGGAARILLLPTASSSVSPLTPHCAHLIHRSLGRKPNPIQREQAP